MTSLAIFSAEWSETEERSGELEGSGFESQREVVSITFVGCRDAVMASRETGRRAFVDGKSGVIPDPTATVVRPELVRLSSEADYVVSGSYSVDTKDCEDHTFSGIMFDVQCKNSLPIKYIDINSVW